jgi:2-polyprenyl-6-methoxyphenol hydroxylase-like FAD-dependent oxidoreductase
MIKESIVSSSQNSVLIVGAGPTGMAAALELSRFGIPVRLIERTPAPATTSRAVGVQARTLELLEQRGLAEQLVRAGNPGIAGSFYGGGKQIFRLDFSHIDSRYGYLLFVSQAETERILREAIEKAGVKVERGVEMIAFGRSEKSDMVRAIIQHADGSLESSESAYLIDAEGAHSLVRATLGLQFEGKTLPEDYALGDLYIKGDLPETDFHIFSSDFGFMGLFPMGGHRFRLMASNPVSNPDKDAAPSIEELQQLYDQRSHIPAVFHNMSWSSWFRINSRMVDHLQTGRVLLGGDAAHIHSPAGAQGMNTGIQDMINLGWKMAWVLKGEAQPKLLDTYSQDRIPVIENVLGKTEGLTGVIGSENPIFRSVFKHIAPWIVGTDFMQSNMTEHMSQIGLGYRDSPLSVSDGHRGSILAGDRVPDMPVMVLPREDSSEPSHTARLFELMDPSYLTLFFSNLNDPAKTHSEFQKLIGQWHYLMQVYRIATADGDAGKRFEEAFGTSSSILLVRPDGYVAFTGSEHSIPMLAKYCAEWFIPKLLSS